MIINNLDLAKNNLKKIIKRKKNDQSSVRQNLQKKEPKEADDNTFVVTMKVPKGRIVTIDS